MALRKTDSLPISGNNYPINNLVLIRNLDNCLADYSVKKWKLIIIRKTLMRYLIPTIALCALTACATITNDENVPVALSFSDGSTGTCTLQNKRVTLSAEIPSTQMIRRSDDNLQYNCTSSNGNTGVGGIPSSMGAKIVASAVFLDLGIVDSITDKHRTYPASFVIPVKK